MALPTSVEPVSYARGGIRKLFETVFRIRPDEFGMVQSFFLYFATIGMFYTFEATVGETLFLARLGTQESQRLLPWAFVGVAVAAAGVTLLYDRIEKRFSRIKLIAGSQVLLALSILAFRWAIPTDNKAVYFTLMVWLEACILFAISVFFSFAGDYFTSRDARRLYGYITGGLSLGIVVSGYAVEPVVHFIGTDNLLFVCAALLVLGAAAAFFIHRSAKPIEHGGSEEDEESGAPLRSVLSSPYLLLTFAIVLVFGAVAVLVDYNMMIAASRQMQEEEMAVFFGRFFGYTGVASLLIQFLLVGWALGRLGAIKSLLILPAIMVLSNLAFFLHPTLMAAAAANFVFLALAETLDMPATELLFLPLPSRIRLRVQTLVDGALVPIGHGLGGLFLILFSGLAADIPKVALAVVVFALLWIALIVLLLPHYRHTLSTSLKERRFDPSDLDALLSRPDSSSVMPELLRSEDPELVLSSLELLRNRPLDKVAKEVGELALSKHETVAVSALQLLGSDRKLSNMPRIRHAMEDPRPGIRSSAVLAFCQVAGQDAVEEAAPYLESEDLLVRRAALHGLACYGGFDGALLAYPKLDDLLKSPSPDDRIEAARVLSQIGDQGATRVMERLFADPERIVRQEALVAARQLRDPGLVPSLLRQMDDLQLRPLAIQALETMPQVAVSDMSLEALDKDAGLTKRTSLARVLGNIGGERAPQILWRLMAPGEDMVVRVSAGQALRRLKSRESLHGLELTGMDDRWNRLCEDLALLQKARQECGKGNPLTAGLLADHARLHVELLMTLLALQHDPHQIQQIEIRIFGDNEALKANALELLEVILPHPAAERLIPLLSDSGASPVEEGKGLPSDTVRSLMKAGPWARAITLYHHAKGDLLPETLGGETMTDQDKDLFKVITTISFLKQVDLFRNVPANYLASLAEIAEEKTAYKGEILFKQGDTGDSLFLIREGKIRILTGKVEAAKLGPRDYIGEMALLDGQPRSATAVVAEDARLLRIDADDFYNLLAAQPAISTALLQTLARRLRETLAKSSPEATKQ